MSRVRVVVCAICAIAGTAGVGAAACAGSEGLHLGMSQEDVVRALGAPDRRAVLEGKVLRDLEPGATPPEGLRLVFYYHADGLQVWLADGKVTGATRGGVTIF